ncbi:P-loop containing nucleoside triphosphate hydrolase protein [Bisporella sp. PMI_857]|nr:P-loop containing nucleoside triphosphate hydrolase protein [Bisporella sp. PMI_857]
MGRREVTFEDLRDGSGMKKAGYEKTRFCGEQARRDGLQYFWVDTCCIDKSSSAELTEAINSMFRWYREATKCYVYLSGVSRPVVKINDLAWESAFRESKWFTRGWTLQELIAPAFVEFFSKEGELLGDKSILEHHVCEITGIPAKALRGNSLFGFTIAERMSWAGRRKTTREEDQAYSLLGILDISMPIIYGEGRDKALKRLRDKTRAEVKREDFSITFSLFDVPQLENFVAREKELAEMHTKLKSDGSRKTIVLHGLGGIGKTQLSIAYAKRHKDNYSAIFWLNIKDKDSLKQSFIKIAKQILRQHPSASWVSNIDFNENLDRVVDAVKAWLSLPDHTRWLLIYDNYDNPKIAGNRDPAAVDIELFLPEAYQGSVIVTTRSSQVDIGYPFHLRKLSNVQESLEILSYTSRREGLVNDPDAIKLAKELDGFPLALATAGAYLNQVSISSADYFRLYKESWAKLQNTSPKLGSYEDRTLYSTWQISYDHVEQRNFLSAKLLRLWAYFDNQDLWFELLRHGDSNDPEWIRELTADELSFHDAVRILSDHGLVEVATSSEQRIESNGYSIHGCVHSWTIHALNREWNFDLARLAIKSVGAHVPGEEDGRPWLMQRRLLQHAARCSYIVVKGLVADDGMDWAYYNLGLLYADQGKLAEAESMYERALAGKEKALGAEHTSTLDTVNNLGLLYADQGKLAEAESMYERALAGKEKALGAEHISTLDTVNNLGNLYKSQGKLAEAESMYERALAGKEKALGAEHISTLNTVNNLGLLYADQGKLAEAESMYEQALAGYEKALGDENIQTHIPALNTMLG